MLTKRLKGIVAAAVLSVVVVFNAGAQVAVADDPIAAMLDSLANKKVLMNALSKPAYPKTNKYHYAADSIPMFDDFVFEARCAKLDAVSPFDLQYHSEVRGYIELYTMRKRGSVERMMGISQLYYPMFEEILDKYNLPLELKHLAVIESALNPNAKSRAGAMGLWQFMYQTGKMYGLSVNSYVDERCDPYKATTAAAEYLGDLYKMFGDWQMVLAAYNAGPGTINKAIRRSGGKKTYWEIRPYLPRETQAYVPAFIAANYVMNYTQEHNLYSATPKKTFFEIDTVVLREPLTYQQLTEVLDVTVEEVEYFNPVYRKRIIPGGGYSLTLPKSKIGKFVTNEEEIYAKIRSNEDQKKIAMETNVPQEKQISYVVKKGEKLSTIARKYGVSVADLKTWNYVNPKKGLKPGRKLVLYVKENSATPVNPETVPTENNQNKNTVAENKNANTNTNTAQKNAKGTKTPVLASYTVKKGDNLFKIAQKYGMSVDELTKLNKMKSSSKINVGMKLKVSKA
ncbi:MAG: transglycosylase SLT domain-containing protein [Bacteroidia bacterium]|nr:transglycosylase SLT domain-containing protein [Bacteroidia bacterium]